MRGTAFRTLFDCSVPMRCHLILRSADPSIFCRASCTRFSPKSCWPAADSGPDVLQAERFGDGEEADVPGPAGRRSGPLARGAAGRRPGCCAMSCVKVHQKEKAGSCSQTRPVIEPVNLNLEPRAQNLEPT